MKTLKELLIEQKARKGKSAGTTKLGAYWNVIEPIKIRSYGGDGIGQNSADRWHKLEFRHFRSNEVKAVITQNSWHQNYGSETSYYDASDVLNCSTIEDVIVALKSINCDETHAYSDSFQKGLTEALTKLGLPESLPAPDEN